MTTRQSIRQHFRRGEFTSPGGSIGQGNLSARPNSTAQDCGLVSGEFNMIPCASPQTAGKAALGGALPGHRGS